MDVWAKLRPLVRKVWRSTDEKRYSVYERGRDRERKEAERRDASAKRSAESQRGAAERERGYELRYDAERAAQEMPPADDSSK